jgi:hypothetical protein
MALTLPPAQLSARISALVGAADDDARETCTYAAEAISALLADDGAAPEDVKEAILELLECSLDEFDVDAADLYEKLQQADAPADASADTSADASAPADASADTGAAAEIGERYALDDDEPPQAGGMPSDSDSDADADADAHAGSAADAAGTGGGEFAAIESALRDMDMGEYKDEAVTSLEEQIEAGDITVPDAIEELLGLVWPLLEDCDELDSATEDACRVYCASLLPPAPEAEDDATEAGGGGGETKEASTAAPKKSILEFASIEKVDWGAAISTTEWEVRPNINAGETDRQAKVHKAKQDAKKAKQDQKRADRVAARKARNRDLLDEAADIAAGGFDMCMVTLSQDVQTDGRPMDTGSVCLLMNGLGLTYTRNGGAPLHLLKDTSCRLVVGRKYVRRLGRDGMEAGGGGRENWRVGGSGPRGPHVTLVPC